MATTVGRRWGLAALLALGALLLASLPAAAISPPNHEDSYLRGDYGVHILIDSGEPYYGVACHYTSGGQLVSFRIRRPIAFAKGHAQYIAWQYQIQGTNDPDPYTATWTTRYTSTLEKRYAADGQPAPFTPKSRHLSGLNKSWYRVVVRIFWYRPASHIDGKAFIAVESYEDDSTTTTWEDACPSTGPATATRTTPSPASQPPNPDQKYVWGTYGVNIVIDEGDPWSYSGAACYYAAGALDHIRIRRPIAFPSGVKQFVAWKYVIEGTNDPDPWTATWHPVASGPLEKVWTTPPQPAPFQTKVYTFSGSPGWSLYRVVDRVFWYKPSNKVVGKSFMALESLDDGANTASFGFETACPALHP